MQPQTALFHSFLWLSSVPLGFPGDSVVKNTPANAGDVSSVPGLKDPLGKDVLTHSSILTWEIPWAEELGGLQSMCSQKSLTQLSD